MRLWEWWFNDSFFVRIWWLYPTLLLGVLTGAIIAEWRAGRRLRARHVNRQRESSAFPVPDRKRAAAQDSQ